MKKILILLICYFISINLNAQKYVVNWPQTAEAGNPQNICNRWNQIETLPFDGLIVFPSQFREVMSNTPITYQSVYFDGKLDLLKTKTDNSRVKNNFLMAWAANGPFDPFDNWDTTIANFAIYARAAKNSNCKGIMFDNEQYYGAGHHLWQYPQDFRYSNTYTELQYRNQMRLRGKQIMDAMRAEFPNIQVIFAHGPYWSEPQAYTAMPQVGIQIPTDIRNGILVGSLFSGFVESAQLGRASNFNPKVVDGGEIYSSFDANYYYVIAQNDYQGIYRTWRKNTIASNTVNSLHIPAAIRGSVWSNNVNISFGLFSNWGNSPANMRNHVEWALRGCDEFIWFYNEGQDWYNNDPAVVSSLSGWKDAIQNGLNAYNNSLAIDNPESEFSKETKIFPNPSNDFISVSNTINSTLESSFEFKIIDVVGKTIKNGIAKYGEKINIQELMSGNYYIQINSNGEKATKRIIIKK